MSLKEKTITGILWSSIDSFAGQGIYFVFGVFLARILSPFEFGLIGILTIFITISQTIIDSGFRQALIRKNNCTQIDYSTVFYFNIIVSILFYFILFLSATYISNFFNEAILKDLIRVLGLVVIINSLAIVQGTILIKQLNFKIQARISIIASSIAGIISIYLAYVGYGVWSLVVLTLVRYTINTMLLWLWCTWKPLYYFSKNSFEELFSFGSKLMISGLIDTIYNNINYLVIGKYFSTIDLGYYTRADQFQALPSSNLQAIIGRVSYPALSNIQDDISKLKDSYRKIIKSTILITAILMFGMAAVARPMILTLIGEKWEQSIIYLQMLCFVGYFYPLHILNLDILKILGKGTLYLRLEIIKKILSIPIIIMAILWGIKIMIIGMIVSSLLSYYINSYWAGRYINYSFQEQIRDILPSTLLSLIMGIIVFIVGTLFVLPPLTLLIIQILFGGLLIIGLFEILHFKDYIYLKKIVLEKIKK